MPVTVSIGAVSTADWPAMAAIHQQGIDPGMATFEAAPPASWESWLQGKVDGCCLAARCGGAVVLWCCGGGVG